MNKNTYNTVNDPGIDLAHKLTEPERAAKLEAVARKVAADNILKTQGSDDPWSKPRNLMVVMRPSAARDYDAHKARKLAKEFEGEGTDYDLSRKAEFPMTEATWRYEVGLEDKAAVHDMGELATLHILPKPLDNNASQINELQEPPQANTAS